MSYLHGRTYSEGLIFIFVFSFWWNRYQSQKSCEWIWGVVQKRTLCSYVASVCFCTWETLLAIKKLWLQLRSVSCVSERFSTEKIQSAFEKHYLRNIICIWTSVPAFKKEGKKISAPEKHCLNLRSIVCIWETLSHLRSTVCLQLKCFCLHLKKEAFCAFENNNNNNNCIVMLQLLKMMFT